MPVEFQVESVEWERVNLTFGLRLGWTPPDGGRSEPVIPAPPRGDDVVGQPSQLVDLEEVDEGPGGAEAEEVVFADVDADASQAGHSAAPGHPVPEEDEVSAPQLVRIFIRDTKQAHPVRWESLGDGRYRVRINLSNFANRAFIPRGTWKFLAMLDSGAEVGGVWELARLEELESLTRAFLFAGNREVFTVSFGLTEDDTNPLFAMRAYSFARKSGGARKKGGPIRRARRKIKSLTSLSRRRQLAQIIYDRTAQAEAAERSVRKAAGKEVKPRVLFASEMRPGIEGNLVAVRDRIVERGLDQQLDLRYSFRTSRTASSRSFLSVIRELARADIVLIDDYFPPLEKLTLKPDCRIIQVWHAGSGFKSVGFSRFGKFGSPGLTNAHRSYTYAITASHHLKHVYAEVFGIEEEAVIPTGLPRIDTFLDPSAQAEARAEVYATFPALQGKRVIMFAPTFRGRGVNQAHYDYDQIDFESLYELCGEDTVVAFRMHHFIHEPVPIPEHMRDRFIDVAEYRNGNNLLLVTDVLVTDYSSIIFEFSLLDRPMLFFAYDQDVYSAVRGFHRPYEETAPGKVCHTFDDLLEAIRTEDYDLDRTAAFRAENFDVIDTHSSDRVIDWLIVGDPPASAVAAVPTDDTTTEAPAPVEGDAFVSVGLTEGTELR